MDRWTDSPASESPDARRSRFRRLIDATREALSGKGAAAAILVRGGVAVGLVAFAAVGAMIQGRSASEPAPSVKTPTFTTVPVVRREPPAYPASASASAAVDPFFAAAPTLPIGQRFMPRARTGPEAFCEDLAAIGFPGARWEPSQVFAGEWECAAPLQTEGADAGSAFLVARGRRSEGVGSLMLRMNPAGDEDRRSLVAVATRVRDVFAAETGLILPDEATKLLEDWTAGEAVGIGGRTRLVADRAKPESRAMNLSVEPRFALPPESACDERCFAEMRARAGVAETRKVKPAAL